MHAIVGTSTIDASRVEEAVKMAEGILAHISQAPGFVSGAFTRSADGTSGRSMILFESQGSRCRRRRGEVPDAREPTGGARVARGVRSRRQQLRCSRIGNG